MHFAQRASIAAGITAGAFALLTTAGGQSWMDGESSRAAPVPDRVGLWWEARYGVQARLLAGPSPTAPLQVRFERCDAAPGKLGFVEFRVPASAEAVLNGTSFAAAPDPLDPTTLVLGVPCPPGGWIGRQIDLELRAFDGTQNADGTPHAIFRQWVSGGALLP